MDEPEVDLDELGDYVDEPEVDPDELGDYVDEPEADLDELGDYVDEPEVDLDELGDYADEPEVDLDELGDYADEPEVDLDELGDYADEPEVDLDELGDHVDEPEVDLDELRDYEDEPEVDLDGPDEDTDESEEDASISSDSSEPGVQYDVSITGQHRYLDEELEEVQGANFVDESYMTIPMIENAHVCLVPGQILPLQIHRPSEICMMRNLVQLDRMFGCKYHGVDYGTMAEIKNMRAVDETKLILKARGVNVYKIIEKWRDSGGILMGRVFILPDGPEYPDPLNYNCLLVPHVSCLNLRRMNGKLLSAATGLPNFIYEMVEPQKLMTQIICHLKDWAKWRCNSKQEEDGLLSLPQSPRDFSFWVAANVPLSDEDRLYCLTMKSSISRLQFLLQVVKSMKNLGCKNCGNFICSTSSIFSLSQSGPQNPFVNPAGYVHETVTVREVSPSVTTLHYTPSKEFSWFPGYEWTLCFCSLCSSSLGWKFTSEKGRKLRPKFFWGLSRSNIRLIYAKKKSCKSLSY